MACWRALTHASFCCLLAATVRAAEPATVETQITLPTPAAPAKSSPPPDEASQAEGYFALGPWRIGMPREEALKVFSDVRATDGDNTFNARAPSHFAADVPAELTFADDRLQTVRLRIYEGTDFEQAVQRMRLALTYMDEHFGGSNFEGGLKTSRDRDATLLRTVLETTRDQFDRALREAAEEQARKRRKKRQATRTSSTAFRQFFHFSTDVEAPNNFLFGQYQFNSDTRQYTVDVYDDREFVASRVPEANVQLFSVPAAIAAE
jgi:hypothetical protein